MALWREEHENRCVDTLDQFAGGGDLRVVCLVADLKNGIGEQMRSFRIRQTFQISGLRADCGQPAPYPPFARSGA